MLASCSNPLETQLMGTWTLQECEIPKLDSVCAAMAEEGVESTNKAIELLRHQLDSTKSADKKKPLMIDLRTVVGAPDVRYLRLSGEGLAPCRDGQNWVFRFSNVRVNFTAR